MPLGVVRDPLWVGVGRARGKDRTGRGARGTSGPGLLRPHAPCRAGFFGTVVEYGAERKISRHSVLGAAVSVGVPQGVSLKVK